jgi:hypothetical protein
MSSLGRTEMLKRVETQPSKTVYSYATVSRKAVQIMALQPKAREKGKMLNDSAYMTATR